MESRGQKCIDRSWVVEADNQARAAGYDETLLLSSRAEVVETTRANIFIVNSNNQISTPSLEGIVPGVTRSWVLENTEAHEGKIYLEDVLNAKSIVLTTAGRGVVPVYSVDTPSVPYRCGG